MQKSFLHAHKDKKICKKEMCYGLGKYGRLRAKPMIIGRFGRENNPPSCFSDGSVIGVCFFGEQLFFCPIYQQQYRHAHQGG